MVARFLHGAGGFEHEEHHENCSIGSLESPFVPANLLRNLWVPTKRSRASHLTNSWYQLHLASSSIAAASAQPKNSSQARS